MPLCKKKFTLKYLCWIETIKHIYTLENEKNIMVYECTSTRRNLMYTSARFEISL